MTGINIDKTAPSVAITSPANGASYTLGQAVAASYTCSDGLSTVASCSGTTAAGAGINTASVGTKSFSVTATDKAGNSAPSTVSYTVGYVFGGFLQPIQAPVATFKAGSTIPVKFKLTNASGAAVTTATAQVSANGAPQGSAEWDGEQYHFNLKTKGLPSGSLTISVALNDGTTKSVTVTLKP